MNEQIVLRFLEWQVHHQHLDPQQKCFQRQPWNVFLALQPWSIGSWWINQYLVLNIDNCIFPFIDIDSYIYDKTFFFSSPVCQTKKTTTPTRSSIGKGSKESRIDITPWQLWQINWLNISGLTNHNKNFFYFSPLCLHQIYLKNEKKYEEERLECVWGKHPEAFKSNHFLSQNLKKIFLMINWSPTTLLKSIFEHFTW